VLRYAQRTPTERAVEQDGWLGGSGLRSCRLGGARPGIEREAS